MYQNPSKLSEKPSSEDKEIVEKESVTQRKIELVTTASSSSFEEPALDNLNIYQKDSSDYDEVPDKKVAQKDSSVYDELSDHKVDLKTTQRDSSDYDELSDNKFTGTPTTNIKEDTTESISDTLTTSESNQSYPVTSDFRMRCG